MSSWPSVQALQKKMEQFLSVVLNGERVQHYFHSTINERTSILETDGRDTALTEEEIMKERTAAKVRGDELNESSSNNNSDYLFLVFLLKPLRIRIRSGWIECGFLPRWRSTI